MIPDLCQPSTGQDIAMWRLKMQILGRSGMCSTSAVLALAMPKIRTALERGEALAPEARTCRSSRAGDGE
jgi:hypothetical protein